MTELADLQRMMELTYGERDRARGIPSTIAWLAEEVGELAKAVRKGSRTDQIHELGDVLAWLASLANQLDVSFEDAVDRYRSGCPRCLAMPCRCSNTTS
jgi:NTP pyrophosphatase (non-canonical NTP hydrolase)